VQQRLQPIRTGQVVERVICTAEERSREIEESRQSLDQKHLRMWKGTMFGYQDSAEEEGKVKGVHVVAVQTSREAGERGGRGRVSYLVILLKSRRVRHGRNLSFY